MAVEMQYDDGTYSESARSLIVSVAIALAACQSSEQVLGLERESGLTRAAVAVVVVVSVTGHVCLLTWGWDVGCDVCSACCEYFGMSR